MAERRTMRPGDSLLEVAYEAGFDSWKRVWNDPANAPLRAVRKDPQVLAPGDELVVPDRETSPQENCPVDKTHRFRLARPRAWLNLRMVDADGEPLDQRRFELSIEGRTYAGRTDDDGMISQEIDPTAHSGRLSLWFDASKPPFVAPVEIGHLDPASTWSGARARATNLGARWPDRERFAAGPTELSFGATKANRRIELDDQTGAVKACTADRLESMHDHGELK